MIPVGVQLLLVLSAGVALAVAWYVRQARADAPGARALLGMLLSVTLWSGAYLLQLSSPTLGGKLFWARFVAAGSVLAVFAYFLFVLRYTGRDRSLTRPRLALLAAVPAITILLAWTNGAHELVWADPGLVTIGEVELLSTTKGPGFLLSLGYGYLLMVVGTLLVAELAWRSEELYRGQAGTLLLATLLPWLGSTAFYALPRAVTPFDPAPLLFSATGLVVAFALYRYHMFELVPVAPDTMISELRDAIVVLDDDDRVSHLNPAARRAFGVEGDGVGLTAAELIPDWEAVDPPAVGADRREELALDVDGERRHFDVRASPLSDYRDRPLGRLLVLRDVTERRERERQLEEYRTVFETVRDAVYVVDADGSIRLVNEPLASMLGTTPGELQGRHLRAVLDDDAYGAATELLAELLADGRSSAVLQFELTDATGEAVPCETEVALLPAEEGFRGAVGTVRDISKLRRTQRSLRETTSTLETVFEASPLAVLTVDRDLEVTRWNPAAESMLGWAASTALGQRFPPTDGAGAEQARTLCRRALAGETLTNTELALPTAAGVDCQVSLAAAPLEGADGDVVGAVVVAADITDRKHREQQLDVLNRVLRHNLRNDMSAIIPSVELLREGLGADERDEIVDDVLERSHRLVDYAGKARQAHRVIDRAGERVRLDPGAVVESAVAAARRRHPGATFAVDVDAAAPVLAQRSLDVAVANLLDNAVEHNDGAEPTVSVTVTDDDGAVAVAVADDGPGIPADEREVLLTGEETPLHHGSGVGLWLVNWIVDRSGGDLQFAENDPRGSVVTLCLQRAGVEEAPEPESVA